ncbi:MAG: L-seryl-tRNA(Sec) selenium transferase [Deltaproteobacteria bacterium]|nr:L-seryl-tRNA(Sec) selenium transferase [Deltaproteobacteria bacterium]
MPSPAPHKLLRTIPKVDLVLGWVRDEGRLEGRPRSLVLEATQQVVQEIRDGMLGGGLAGAPDRERILEAVVLRAESLARPSLRPAINATGVVLHTNLGRSVLSPETASELMGVACNYSTLEYDPGTGARGDRQRHVESLILKLFPAEAALAVNNNAAAVLLIMSALGRGGEAVISRGDLVEIGDSFRLADIMAEGGVTLREVGASNRTRADDYEKAIVPGKTALIVKVHPSNFRLLGYCGQTEIPELAKLARERGVPLVCDLGSGSAVDLAPRGLPDEPAVGSALAAGADLVTMSGDKLLGAGQAGLVVGRGDLVDVLRRHPLARALRIDKLSLAALELTLRAWLHPGGKGGGIPTLDMLSLTQEELRHRAGLLLEAMPEHPDLTVTLRPLVGQAGGGAGPEWPLPSWGLAVKCRNVPAAGLERGLRQNEPPVVARISQGELLLDARTVLPWQREELARALAGAAGLGDAPDDKKARRRPARRKTTRG